MKNLFNQAKAKLKLFILSNEYGDDYNFKDISIDEIPVEYTKFGTSNDEWVSLQFPNSEDITSALYKGTNGSIFPPHKHSNNNEHITILNQGGKVEVITTKGSKIIEFPNSYFFEKNKVHSVKFLTETKLLITWTPKFKKGWSGDFIEIKP